MPRRRKGDIFSAIRARVAKALTLLENEIRRREADLRHMVAQADGWHRLLGGGRGPARKPALAARGPGRRVGGKRVNWDEVLGSLPNRFGVDDVLKHPGAAAKGRNQVYPALTRWEAAKRIRRVSKGVYEKGGTALTKAAGKSTRKRSAAARQRESRAKTATRKKTRGKQKTTAAPVAA